MALRPLRNATISFGLVSCGTRVNRKWWCPHHEEMIET